MTQEEYRIMIERETMDAAEPLPSATQIPTLTDYTKALEELRAQDRLIAEMQQRQALDTYMSLMEQLHRDPAVLEAIRERLAAMPASDLRKLIELRRKEMADRPIVQQQGYVTGMVTSSSPNGFYRWRPPGCSS